MKRGLCLTVALTVLAGMAGAADFERMAAHHETIVATYEGSGVSGVFTYVQDRVTPMELYLLARLQPETRVAGAWRSAAQAVRCEDFPGGVDATMTLGDVESTTQIVPLLVGRATREQEGLAWYRVSSGDGSPVRVLIDGGRAVHRHQASQLTRGNCGQGGHRAEQRDDRQVLIRGENLPLTVGVRVVDGGTLQVQTTGQGACVVAGGDSAALTLMVAYAPTAEATEALLETPAEAARAAVASYYDRLLQARVNTPVRHINEAFRSAIYNLEYNWLTPYGWNECIQHWLALWHMHHSGGAEWIGQEDRSRETTMTQATDPLGHGGIAQFMPNGFKRDDWGGTNQFWAWQVRHYLKFTGERRFAEEIAPHFDRVLQQTIARYDPDGNGLFAWGLQIGNQEDFVTHPHDGTAPTIELINMMRTRAEIADVLDDAKTAATWRARAEQSREALRRTLWLQDLGRFGFFVDGVDMMHLEGPYQAFLYPVIWDIVDELDGYTGIRHLRDRLVGPDGAVYCSNNFPEHYVGTWGMQGGAAQQPWGAWGLAKIGQADAAGRCLQVVADWVMNEDHRGSWPEVSIEPKPTYFSPPAGLYIAALIEAIYGLQPDLTQGRLRVAPAFPSDWPTAELTLPKYTASFQRQGTRLAYAVNSASPLVREIRWKLPPARVASVTVNGTPLEYRVAPGVGCIEVRAETEPLTESVIEVAYEPYDYTVTHAGSLAEGDDLVVTTEGVKVVRLVDRCGLLAESRRVGASRVEARLQDNLVTPYLRFRRLGLLNFARRTCFLEVATPDGQRFYEPVDVAVLPRYDAVAAEAALGPDGLQVPLTVQNNRTVALRGTAWLELAGQRLAVAVALDPRSTAKIDALMPLPAAQQVSPGDNAARLVMPDGVAAEFVVTVREPFAVGAWAPRLAERLVPVDLAAEAMIVDTRVGELRFMMGNPHIFVVWPDYGKPLESLAGRQTLGVPEIPGLVFPLQDRQMLPVSRWASQPLQRVALPRQVYKKLYILLLPLVDNHDMYSEVARVTLYDGYTTVHSQALCYPGDMDYFDPHQQSIGGTVRGRQTRYGLLPQLQPHEADWDAALVRPPAFPEAEFWSRSVPVLESATLTVLEIDLGRAATADSLVFECLGEATAFGVLSVVAEPAFDPAMRTLFELDAPKALADWTVEGTAFGVTAVPALFTRPTLNSLGTAGETATGRALSPAFEIRPQDETLLLEFQGGRSATVDGQANLALQLIDADSQAVLATLPAPVSHTIGLATLDVKLYRGRTVRLQLVDANTDTSYAWIGLASVRMRAVE